MGLDQSKPGRRTEKSSGKSSKFSTGGNGESNLPDVPEKLWPRFSSSLLHQMKTDVSNIQSLTEIIVTDQYVAHGKTIDKVKDEQGLTVLHAAVLAQQPQVVKLLLEAGCQSRTLSNTWQTALHDAILLGNHDIVALLLEFGAPNVCLSTNDLGELPVHFAAQLFNQLNGDKIFWDILICSGSEELNRITPSGKSVLHLAALENYTKLIKLLVDPTRTGPKCFINLAAADGITPLHAAVLKSHKRATQILLDYGADPNATNFFGETPLHWACQSDSDACIEAILSVDPLWRKGDSKRPEFDDQLKNNPRAHTRSISSNASSSPTHFTSSISISPSSSSSLGPSPKNSKEMLSMHHNASSHGHSATVPGAMNSPNDSGQRNINSLHAKDSNHLKLVVVESKDFGRNLPLHYAVGWIPTYSRKMTSTSAPLPSPSSHIVDPMLQVPPLQSQRPPDSFSSSSSSKSSSNTNNNSTTSNNPNNNGNIGNTSNPSSNSGSNNSTNSTSNSPTNPSNPSSNATNSSNSIANSNEEKENESSLLIKPRSISLGLVERMLDLEMRHSRRPLNRKYAFSIVTPNKSGYSPLDIAEHNGDTELLELFKFYAPPPHLVPSQESMLSIQLASDLHLECLAHDQPSGRKMARKLVGKSKAKYLALLGDIGIAIRPHYRDFLVRLSKKYVNVFVLYGNHEYYHSHVAEALQVIDSVSKEYPNIIWLKAGTVFEVEGVKIIGDTLWSHVTEDEMEAVGMHLSDYRYIDVLVNPSSQSGTTSSTSTSAANTNTHTPSSTTSSPSGESNGKTSSGERRKLTVNDTLTWHKEQLSFIRKEIEKSKKINQPVVVMTHHAPLMRFGVSNPGHWESAEASVNTAFCTDLGGLFATPVVAWLYGHTHWNHEMIINDTLIAANQGGYILGEPPVLPTNYDPKFVVQVPKQLISSSSQEQVSTSGSKSTKGSRKGSKKLPVS